MSTSNATRTTPTAADTSASPGHHEPRWYASNAGQGTPGPTPATWQTGGPSVQVLNRQLRGNDLPRGQRVHGGDRCRARRHGPAPADQAQGPDQDSRQGQAQGGGQE